MILLMAIFGNLFDDMNFKQHYLKHNVKVIHMTNKFCYYIYVKSLRIKIVTVIRKIKIFIYKKILKKVKNISKQDFCKNLYDIKRKEI